MAKGPGYRHIGHWRLVATVSLVAPSFAGCGKADSPPALPPSASTPEVPTTPSPAPSAAPDGTDLPISAPTTAAPPPRPAPEETRWLLIGGGADPASTELQIEADTLAAASLLTSLQPQAGIQLFAGGSGAFGVHESPADPPGGDIPLREVIATIFGNHTSRARYRPHRIAAHGPADEATTVATLETLAAATGPAVTLWLSGHGESVGPTDSAFSLWGGAFLTPVALAATWAESQRSLRVIAASCHSGAWTEIVFTAPGASEPFGVPGGPVRCALTATTWDRVASGCDPDPDRKARESWARILVEGVSGKTVDGQMISAAERDFDGDGITTMLEAHMRAVVVSRGFDVPTTSTGRWLAHVAGCDTGLAACEPPIDAPANTEWEWPEVKYAISALSARLGVSTVSDLDDRVTVRIGELMAAREGLRHLLDERLADEEAAAAALRGGLLARWPVLGDPWHPRFQATLDTQAEAIVAFLTENDSHGVWQGAVDAAMAAQERLDEVELDLAPWLRLQMLMYQQKQAAVLMAREPNDDARRRFEALLACERGTP